MAVLEARQVSLWKFKRGAQGLVYAGPCSVLCDAGAKSLFPLAFCCNRQQNWHPTLSCRKQSVDEGAVPYQRHRGTTLATDNMMMMHTFSISSFNDSVMLQRSGRQIRAVSARATRSSRIEILFSDLDCTYTSLPPSLPPSLSPSLLSSLPPSASNLTHQHPTSCLRDRRLPRSHRKPQTWRYTAGQSGRRTEFRCCRHTSGQQLLAKQKLPTHSIPSPWPCKIDEESST